MDDDYVHRLEELSAQSQKNVESLTSLIEKSNQQYLDCVVKYTQELESLRKERDDLKQEQQKEKEALIARYEKHIERISASRESVRAELTALRGQLAWANEQLGKFIMMGSSPQSSIAIGGVHNND